MSLEIIDSTDICLEFGIVVEVKPDSILTSEFGIALEQTDKDTQ